jgi:hypothetical protein
MAHWWAISRHSFLESIMRWLIIRGIRSGKGITPPGFEGESGPSGQ